MDNYHSFLNCHGRKATHRVEADRASAVPPTHPCFTRDGAALLLCDSCFAFWRECRDVSDNTTWTFSLYLRNRPEADTLHASRR